MAIRSTYNEKELLLKLSKGDQKAFQTIYESHFDSIYNYLLKFTKNPAATKDLAQDLFIKIWEMKEHLQVETSLSAYLYRMARNRALNLLSQIALHDTIKDEIQHRSLLGLDRPQLIDQMDWAQYERLLHQAIRELPQQRQQAFLLCRVQGKTYEEAASAMQISRHTIKEHLSLAVKSIKQFLKEKGDIVLMLAWILAS
ncbi:MAG: sigma-70 family RNA polymerase sigma factor [Chitinophagaceae bacterium]|nr:sigma-70 family RNA polymerase sigma factor [Chitinophagaceae bacterium]